MLFKCVYILNMFFSLYIMDDMSTSIEQLRNNSELPAPIDTRGNIDSTSSLDYNELLKNADNIQDLDNASSVNERPVQQQQMQQQQMQQQMQQQQIQQQQMQQQQMQQ